MSARIKIVRVQDRKGRGPWRPGFSSQWTRDDTPMHGKRIPPFGRVQFSPQTLAQEMGWCRALGLDYVATDPVSHFVLQSDDMRREGHERAAHMLRCAAAEIARARKIAAMCVRRSAVLSKPKRRAS